MSKHNCILLVDDDSINNYINLRIIKKLDIAEKIEIASNGKEALSLINKVCSTGDCKCCPQVIFLDINMPVMNGFEFVEALQQTEVYKNHEIKIIFLTTSQEENDIKEIFRLGIYDYINKPLTEYKVMNYIA